MEYEKGWGEKCYFNKGWMHFGTGGLVLKIQITTYSDFFLSWFGVVKKILKNEEISNGVK